MTVDGNIHVKMQASLDFTCTCIYTPPPSQTNERYSISDLRGKKCPQCSQQKTFYKLGLDQRTRIYIYSPCINLRSTCTQIIKKVKVLTACRGQSLSGCMPNPTEQCLLTTGTEVHLCTYNIFTITSSARAFNNFNSLGSLAYSRSYLQVNTHLKKIKCDKLQHVIINSSHDHLHQIIKYFRSGQKARSFSLSLN